MNMSYLIEKMVDLETTQEIERRMRQRSRILYSINWPLLNEIRAAKVQTLV